MGQVRAGHEEIVIADAGELIGLGIAVDGGVLANDIIVADTCAAGDLGVEVSILRVAANDGTCTNLIVIADGQRAFEVGIGANFTVFTNGDSPLNDHEGGNLAARGNVRLFGDFGSRVNHAPWIYSNPGSN